MIDLHLHTYYSDGTLSPKELVKQARELGLKAIAVTDHDGTGGVEEARKAGEALGLAVIPGLELSAGLEEGCPSYGLPDYPGQEVFMHILGYGIDPENRPLAQELRLIAEQRKSRNRELLAALRGLGFDLREEDLYQRPGLDYVGKPNFAMALVEKGYVKTPSQAFESEQYLRHPDVRRVHRDKLPAPRVISLIQEAGGKAVLAHPLKIPFLGRGKDGYLDRLEALLDQLVSYGLSGLECYYSQHSPEQTEALLKLAKKRGLLVTAGSDFHGPGVNWVKRVGEYPLADRAESHVKPLLTWFKKKGN